MNSGDAARLRRMQASDLRAVYRWRNDASIRRQMFATREFTYEEHERWFDNADRDPKRRLLILERAGVASAYLHFGPIADGGIAAWGFYAAPDAAPGTGRALGEAALSYAFEELGLHKVWGEALASNESSLRFHLRLGFRQEGGFVSHHFDGTAYHDVLRFGLLASDWRARREGGAS